MRNLTPEEEVREWARRDPSDQVGKPTVWDPDGALTNESSSAMMPPDTRYESRGSVLQDAVIKDGRE